MGRPVFYICPLRTLRLAINCLAVRGVRPGLRISPHGRFPPVGAPFFHSLEAKSIRLNQGSASGKTLVRRGAAGRFRARGRCGTPSHRLRLAINCFTVRGVRPGLRISSHGRFPPAGAPFFHSVEAKSIRLNQGFASGKTLVRRGAAGRFRARGRCGIPSHRLRLAINCFAVRGVRPGLRISSHGRFPPAGAPFFHSVEAKSIRLNQGFASGKTLVRRGAAGRFHARGRCGILGHRLRLAMNCFAIRGVRPGLRISPHGRFPPAGAPFSILLRRSQFASTKVLPPAKRLYAAGRRGASAPVGDAGHPVTGSGWR